MRFTLQCVIPAMLVMLPATALSASIFIDQVGTAAGEAPTQYSQPPQAATNGSTTPRDAAYTDSDTELEGSVYMNETNLRSMRLENDAANNPTQLSTEQAGTLQFIGSQQDGNVAANSGAARDATAAVDPLTGAINLGLPNGQTITIPTR